MSKDVCTVKEQKVVYASDEYVTILGRKDGSATLHYHADAMTLGIAYKLISTAFKQSLEELPLKDSMEILDILKLKGAI